MHQIAVVYFSKEGNTASLASAVCDGISEITDAEALLLEIEGADIVQGRYVNTEQLHLLHSCRAIMFGSPTYMGGPAAQFKAFADATSDFWQAQRLRGKLAAGFTCGSSPNGDQLATLQYFSILAAQHGMLWVNLDISDNDIDDRNRLGTQLGVSALSEDNRIISSDLATAEYLGKRVAHIAVNLPGV